MSKQPGIYKIINIKTKKVYIGQTREFKNRWYGHKYAVKKKRPETIIQYYMMKDGIENYKFEIIESFESYNKDKLNERENYWIKKFDNVYNGEKIPVKKIYMNDNEYKKYSNCSNCNPVSQDKKAQI